ncbi:hypothetical protein ACFPFP_17520 [Bradyrhizobium sp. GCM10023182]|uniref:Uncharacterized protein n=1 Tax=Bradyrhizobium zhengyangense TaxID=2911009 RepID=A0ABS9LPI6_9BRAD|nr:hypothetical protein [Bradyrhizobium zhengyangense]MCG2668753.1 hypothetical protein [Bradyrhizobium zhengyangense]
MTFFSRKGSATARMQADPETLRARRNDLQSQHDEATSAVTSLTEALHAALIGDAPRDEAEQVEARLADAERRASALGSAIAALDTTIAEVEEQIVDAERRRVAQEQADALDVAFAEFAAKMDAFAQAASELAPVAERLSEKLLSAKRLAVIARATATEFPIAKNGLADEARYTKEMILQRGSERPARAA